MRVDRWFILGLAAALFVGVHVRGSKLATTVEPLPPSSVQAIVDRLRSDDDGRARGAALAPHHLVELVDLECEACATVHEALEGLLDDLIALDRLRLTIYDHPLPIHANAMAAAAAVRCAADVHPDRAWPFQAALVRRQDEWTASTDVYDRLAGLGASVGLDRTLLTRCLLRTEAEANAELEGRSRWLIEQGVSYSPFFILDDEHVPPERIMQRLEEIGRSR